MLREDSGHCLRPVESTWKRSKPLHEDIGQCFRRAAAVEGLGVGFWKGPGNIEHYTYAKLAKDAENFAAGLQALGVGRGQRVALVLPTGPDFYIAWFGCVLARAVPVALYPPVRLGRFEEWRTRTAQMLKAASCVAVITERRLQGFLGEPVAEVNPPYGCKVVATVQQLGQERNLFEHPVGEMAAVQFSSGTTGDPKPVVLTHTNMLSNARAILSKFPGKIEDHIGVSWLPLYHDMGLVGCLLAAVAGRVPLTLIAPERFVARPVSWLQAISETRATISVAPNFAFGLVSERVADEDLKDIDLSCWEIALCGAEPVHPKTLDRFTQKLATTGFEQSALTPVYGLAEATLAVTFSEIDARPKWTRFDTDSLENDRFAIPSESGRRLASLGRPLDCRIAIRDASNHELDECSVGTVHVKGPGVMAGYLDRDTATEAVMDRRGWLNTGDSGFIYKGELYLCGREKDLIIIRGRNHDPSLVEQALDGLPGLRTGCAAAFACSDEASDTERLIVVAEVRAKQNIDASKIKQEARRRIQAHTGLQVSEIQLVDAGTLPRTSSGKIRRAEARRHFESRTLSAPERVNLGLVVRENVRGVYHHAMRQLRRPPTPLNTTP